MRRKNLIAQKISKNKIRNLLLDLVNSFLILFTVRPVITVPDLRIFIRPGEDVSLECIFEFHPRGLMWWERESGEILSRNDKYSVADYILNEFTIRSRLIIRNFEDSDVGRYAWFLNCSPHVFTNSQF